MNPYQIVVWGDSIAGMEPDPWPVRLEFTHNVCVNPGRKIRVINSGICGIAAAQAKLQFQDAVARHRPDMVMIQFGFNDMRYDGVRPGLPISTPDEFGQHMRQMIRACQSIPSEVLVLGNHLPFLYMTLPSGLTREESVVVYNDAARCAAEECGVAFLNMAQVDLHGLPPYLLTTDGVHLSEYGCRMYAQTIASYVSNVLSQR